MAIFGVPSRAGATHVVQVGPVRACAAEASAPQPRERFGKVTPQVRGQIAPQPKERLGKVEPHVHSHLPRICFRAAPVRRGCAAHSYGTVAILYGVFLHTKPPPRGKSPVAAPQKECGAVHAKMHTKTWFDKTV